MEISIGEGMRELDLSEVSAVSGGAEEEPSIYYSMGHFLGEVYYSARLHTADFYEWVADL